MIRLIFVSALVLLAVTVAAQQTIRISVSGLPANQPPASSLFIAGSFNNWNPANQQYKFQQDEKGIYFINLELNTGTYEYKITRGGWDKVECSKQGSGIGNRTLSVKADDHVEITIAGWQDLFQARPRTSTASAHVRIIDTAFWMPQLKRTRRIWIYLPENYTSQRWPVLYMHDGQNLFDDTSSFAGEWGVDEFLDSTISKNCIVVGIDNGGDQRLSEYAPYDFRWKGRNSDTTIAGKGNDYVQFIVKRLKPFIDKHYRTKKGKNSTMIAGSSMGGLISMYAVVKYPNIFGGAAVFSPAFWTNPRIFDDIKAKGRKIKSNIFFFAGKQESERMVPDMLKAMEALSATSKSRIKTVIRDEGKHNEATWRKEFPGGFWWMMNNGR